MGVAGEGRENLAREEQGPSLLRGTVQVSPDRLDVSLPVTSV